MEIIDLNNRSVDVRERRDTERSLKSIHTNRQNKASPSLRSTTTISILNRRLAKAPDQS